MYSSSSYQISDRAGFTKLTQSQNIAAAPTLSLFLILSYKHTLTLSVTTNATFGRIFSSAAFKSTHFWREQICVRNFVVLLRNCPSGERKFSAHRYDSHLKENNLDCPHRQTTQAFSTWVNLEFYLTHQPRRHLADKSCVFRTYSQCNGSPSSYAFFVYLPAFLNTSASMINTRNFIVFINLHLFCRLS